MRVFMTVGGGSNSPPHGFPRPFHSLRRRRLACLAVRPAALPALLAPALAGCAAPSFDAHYAPHSCAPRSRARGLAVLNDVLPHRALAADDRRHDRTGGGLDGEYYLRWVGGGALTLACARAPRSVSAGEDYYNGARSCQDLVMCIKARAKCNMAYRIRRRPSERRN